VVGRGELTDQAWAVIEPLLPPNRRSGGQWADHRRTINGIPTVLGCPGVGSGHLGGLGVAVNGLPTVAAQERPPALLDAWPLIESCDLVAV
jgi:transposase